MCPTNLYDITLERCFWSASAAYVCCIKIHAEIKELFQDKEDFIFKILPFSQPFSILPLNIHVI